MVTQICTLTFANGQVVTATVTAAFPTIKVAVNYAGELALLPQPLKDRATPDLLDAHLSELAETLGASYATSQTGDYENWAE